MDISTIRSILNGDSSPNTGQYRVAMGKLYDFLSAMLGTNSDDVTTLAGLLGVTLPQRAGVVGLSRNAKMTIPSASASATFTADEVIVESALGGSRYCVSGINQTINLATTGVGGMDTGSAPNSGYAAVYEILNPTSGQKGLLAANATSARAPEVYGGTNMPSGYTASALVAVLPTDPTGKFVPLNLTDRIVEPQNKQVLSTTTTASSPASLSVSGAVPINARRVSLNYLIASSATSSLSAQIGASSTVSGGMIGSRSFGVTAPSVSGSMEFSLITAQTIYYTWSSTAGTPGLTLNVTGYTF